ncbi:hypothetical protein ACOSZH_17735 [Priestia megaterium]|uniref:hypothetical protein n=1 Tax=Priestia TaxID=2800373 RepID=UPI00211C2E85|nr:hypothetical protein [Priestia aryabhattai]MCQ9283300.1 hypothetical protein [Priestia aryabhattai]
METHQLIRNLEWTKNLVAEKNGLENKTDIAKEEIEKLRGHFPFKSWTSPLKKRYWAIAITGISASNYLKELFPPLKTFDNVWLTGIYNRLNPVEGNFMGGVDDLFYAIIILLAPYFILMSVIRLLTNALTKPSRLHKANRNESLVKEWSVRLEHITKELKNESVIMSENHLNVNALDFFLNSLREGETTTLQDCVRVYNQDKRMKNHIDQMRANIEASVSASIESVTNYYDSEMDSMSSKIDDLERENSYLHHNRY